MLQIGQFARLGRVSVKTLRHYDEIGLLRPSHIDRQSGYRFYAAAQLVTLARILQLKELGLPLAAIARSLNEPDTLDTALAIRRRELEQAIAADRARLRRLDTLRAALAERAGGDVVIRRIEPVWALSARARVRGPGGEITHLFEDLEHSARHARAAASPFLLIHERDGPDGGWDVEACVPVRPEAEFGGAAGLVEGAAEAAAVTFRGPYAGADAIVERLSSWCATQATAPGGPLRETYFAFGADQDGYRLPRWMLAARPSEYVTEIALPIAVFPSTAEDNRL
ncbi:MerR family transcriptional regulator [Gloeobacter violaceus]|uniref:MerR family transcriptional regulatory protein n=1 Tax=Gloeobacter violaceus (strain ATCC 29082 / PCC 7421) TaxID=251221 RepID=Q7NFT0_GLOVI|nr:MerR family transcriptional regulator [Gloeobacter violaceus]BAC91385.1 MerR family transcriptional regulatory protein [Gloeobacter violaceus PCC 7421]